MKNRCAIAGVGMTEPGKVWGTSALRFNLEGCKRAIEGRGHRPGRDRRGPGDHARGGGGAARLGDPRRGAPGHPSPALRHHGHGRGDPHRDESTPRPSTSRRGWPTPSSARSGCRTTRSGSCPSSWGARPAIPYGDIGAITYMAHVARRQMHEYGYTSPQYGEIAVAFRHHASMNPIAPEAEADHHRGPPGVAVGGRAPAPVRLLRGHRRRRCGPRDVGPSGPGTSPGPRP